MRPRGDLRDSSRRSGGVDIKRRARSWAVDFSSIMGPPALRRAWPTSPRAIWGAAPSIAPLSSLRGRGLTRMLRAAFGARSEFEESYRQYDDRPPNVRFYTQARPTPGFRRGEKDRPDTSRENIPCDDAPIAPYFIYSLFSRILWFRRAHPHPPIFGIVGILVGPFAHGEMAVAPGKSQP